MSNRRSRVRHTAEAVVLLGLTLVTFAPWGCSTAPLAPIAPESGGFVLPNGVIARPGQLLPETDPAPAGKFTLVSPAHSPASASSVTYGPFVLRADAGGGQVPVDIGGELSYFIVPAGALPSAVEISVWATRGQNAGGEQVTTFSFSPSGLVFAEPAHLAYRSALAAGEIQLLYWFDPVRAEWFSSSVAVAQDGYATFPIGHFSNYGTTERISLGGQ